MKLPYYIILSFLLPINTHAQTLPEPTPAIPVVTINARLIGKDSVVIPYDNNYVIVQEACTRIIRYGHYNFKDRLFFGKFKDKKADDTATTIAEGAFSKKGLKEGLFVLHYLDGHLEARGSFGEDKYDGPWVFYYPNGNLRAKGSFKKDKYVGSWETYYENGRPQLFFDAGDEVCKIWSAWRVDGTKIVNQGNGNYQLNESPRWIGKLKNGLPDSTWTCSFTFKVSATAVEYFKNGKFYRGYAESGSISRQYNDKSAISLLPSLPGLRINHSQYLDISASCNGAGPKNVDINIFNTTYHSKTISLSGSRFYKDPN